MARSPVSGWNKHESDSLNPVAKQLHLVIPGLLGPWLQTTKDIVRPGALQMPALERLLSRATVSSSESIGLEQTLFALFDAMPPAPGDDLPVAAFTRLADGGEKDNAWWLRADPVHLRADLQQAILFDARMLDIDTDEATDLALDLAHYLEREGWHLEALHPHRWYLKLDHKPKLSTVSLPDAIGKNIQTLLPQGPDKERWHKLMTEIQMLFHSSDVNSERDWDNQLAINSVWFWGCGRLPQPRPAPVDEIYARDPLSQGLGLHTGIVCAAIPETVADWQQLTSQGNRSLVVLETIRYYILNNDYYRWCDRLKILEQNWFSRCVELIRTRQLERLVIYPCNGRVYSIDLADLRRFWRPTRSFTYFLNFQENR